MVDEWITYAEEIACQYSTGRVKGLWEMVLFQYGVLRCRLEIRVYIYIYTYKIFNTMWDVSVILFLFFWLILWRLWIFWKITFKFFRNIEDIRSILECLLFFFLINNLVSLSDLTLSFIDYQIESNIRLSIGDKNNNSIIWRNFKKKDFSSIIELKNGKRGEKLFEVITWSFECEDIVPGSYIWEKSGGKSKWW